MSIIAWVGLAVVIGTGFLLTSSTAFPGYIAAAPVLGTALVILGGSGTARGGPSLVLSVRPLLFFGGISYSLYLVHWALLVIPQNAVGLNHPLPLWTTLLLGTVAIPVAWLSYRYIEQPGRRASFLVKAPPRRTLFTVLAASAVIAIITVTGSVVATSVPLNSTRSAATSLFAEPQGTSYVPSNLSPTLRDAGDDNPAIYSNGCHRGFASTDPSGCTTGTNAGAPLVALFGDSHAAQWYPALEKLAKAGKIRLDSNTKSSCGSAETPHPGYEACGAWRAAVIDRLADEKPDLILLGNFTRVAATGPNKEATWRQALSRTINELSNASTVIVLADTPFAGSTPAICLSAHLNDATSCGIPRDAALDRELRSGEAGLGDGYIDLSSLMCNSKSCPAVIGNVLVYRDAHHITATFSEALSTELGKRLDPYLTD